MRIRVTWPDRAYHGREWPPSPLRLYSALVAGTGPASLADPALRAALDHLSGLSPPTIIASHATAEAPQVCAVPNNDGDIILGYHARGDRDGARKQVSKLRALRRRQRWLLDARGQVHYLWQDQDQTAEHLPAFRQLAAGVTALGHGRDTAWATIDADQSYPTGLLRWEPTEDGRHALRVPSPGTLDLLEARYQALRHRVDASGTVYMVAEPQHRSAAYRCELDPPRARWLLMTLRSLDDQPWSAPGSEAMAVAAMTRHALHRAAQGVGLEQARIADLLGHGDEQHRMTGIPLPNVGHLYADGRIRRLLLVAPMTLDQQTWEAVASRLVGAELQPPGGEPEAMLAPAAADDRLRDRYLAAARTWVSATPVILPGWDTRRGKPRPQRVLQRLLRHAGIDPALLASASFEPAPLLRGAMRCEEVRVPRHLQEWPRAHLTLHWRLAVYGPIALGAGVSYGYGLFTTA